MTLLPPIPPSQPSGSFGFEAEDYRRERGDTKTPSLLKDAPPLLLIATGILLGLAGVAQLVHTFRRGQDD